MMDEHPDGQTIDVGPVTVGPMRPPSALRAYEQAKQHRSESSWALDKAEQAFRLAVAAEKEMLYRAVTAVMCPLAECGAEPGQDCDWGDDIRYHRYMLHGVRQELSGVKGSIARRQVLTLISRKIAQGDTDLREVPDEPES